MTGKLYISLLFAFLPILPLRMVGQAAPFDIACWGEEVVYSITGSENSTFEWFVSPDSVRTRYLSARGDSFAVTWNHKVGNYTLFVRERSEYGCYGPYKSATVKVSAPVIRLPELVSLCKGTEFTLSVRSGYATYRWNGVETGLADYVAIMEESGFVSVTAGDEYGCETTVTTLLTAYDLPVASLGPDTLLCEDETLVLNGGEAFQYLWNTGENTQTILIPEGENNYWVRLTSEYGCTDTDTIHIYPCDNRDIKDQIPNFITPNGDLSHEYWVLPFAEQHPTMTIEVFDRWGILVFKSEGNYQNDWNGRSRTGKPLPMDSYYFIINLKDGSKPLTGNISIIR